MRTSAKPRHKTLHAHLTTANADERYAQLGTCRWCFHTHAFEKTHALSRPTTRSSRRMHRNANDARARRFPIASIAARKETAQHTTHTRTNVHSSRTFSLSHGRASNPEHIAMQPSSQSLRHENREAYNRKEERRNRKPTKRPNTRIRQQSPKRVANSRPRDAQDMLTEESLPNG